MAHQGIPFGKKRLSITLNTTTINRMHAYLGKIHQPKALMSHIIDEQLTALLDSLESFERMQAQKGSQLGMGDFFSVIGEQLNKLTDEQKTLPMK